MSDEKTIYQRFLDETSSAVWEERWDDLADAMAYPHIIGTVGHVADVPDRETLIAMAQGFRRNMTDLGATAYYRICHSAQFTPDQEAIDGRHQAYVLRGGTTLLPPFTSQMVLIRKNGRWLGSGIRSNVRNADIAINSHAPRGSS